MRKFILTDESLNSYGFRVRTAGIDLSRFRNNPIMYYNHERERGVIGKWEDVELKGDKLFATPVFDEKDKLGKKIAGKVKDGFIKAVSVGLSNAVMERVGDEYIVTSCQLQECSVCDIPSNENALMLYVDDKQITDKEEILKLCVTYNNDDMKIESTPIAEALGLKASATSNEIVLAIQGLKESNSPESLIAEALDMKLIAKYEKDELLQLAQASPTAFSTYLRQAKRKGYTGTQRRGFKACA